MATMPNAPVTIRVDCKSCQARVRGLCKDKPKDVLQIIAGHKSGDRRLNAGQDLFRMGDHCDAIYNLVDGWMCQYTLLPDGRRQILNFALPGDLLGFHAAYGSVTTYSAQALTDVIVCVIPAQAFTHLPLAWGERP